MRLRFRRSRVILAMADPEALRRAIRALEGRRGIEWLAAPTTDALAALLRQGPARVIWHPSFQEGETPRPHLDGVLAGAVPLEAFLADPEGVLRTGQPGRLSALPPGLYVVAGCAGGVGATAAAEGLWAILRGEGERAALLEIPGPARPAAGLARGQAADLAGWIPVGGELPPGDRFALEGWTAAELAAGRPEAVARALDALQGIYRLAILDLSPDSPAFPLIAPRAAGGILLLDLRPEGERLAERIAGAFPRSLRALVARWGEASGIPHEVRLDPPPRPERWGRALARALLRHLLRVPEGGG